MGVSRCAGAGGRAGGRCVGARGAQATARSAGAVGACVGARGARHGARGACGLGVPVRAGWACWLVSWAKLVHCAPGSVLTQFLTGLTRYYS